MYRLIRADQVKPSPYNHHVQEFLTFLKHERGFADATIVNRERSLKPFLGWLVAQDVPLPTVSPVVITKYFTSAVAGRWKRTTISFHVYSLRSFFRFASNRGWCAAGIAESIDAPRVYTYESLPQGPTWEEVKKLFTSVNGTSPVQIRSRCAILLCSVYGLRVGEICCLRLEDIDWVEERISVRRPKQRKAQTYPLTTEVGNALLRYLKVVRPRGRHREVLLTLRRPYRPVSVGALSTMTRKLQKRLGLKLKRYGSHVLRHACATHLLAQGLTLKEVGDHLGHMSVAATRIYAKVDLVSSSVNIAPLTILPARAIGLMTMIDAGKKDHKIIAIATGDPEFNSYHQVSELPQHRRLVLRRFFQDYKKLENKVRPHASRSLRAPILPLPVA